MARQEPDTDIVFQLLFRRLAVLLIECKEEKRQRRDNQQNQGNIVAQAVAGQKVGGCSHQRGQHKKDKLAAGQAEHNLAFDLG